MPEIIEALPSYLTIALKVIIILIATTVLERLSTKYLKKYARKVELSPTAENALVTLSRFIIILGGIAALFELGGLPSDWFVGFSALAGTAIGFASTKSIGNFIAGLYVLISRPFNVGDYVRVGDVEGIVEEISINYTKILTPSLNHVLISNQDVMSLRITNFKRKSKDLTCYMLPLEFPRDFQTEKIDKILEEVISEYEEKLPRKPEYAMASLDRLSKRYYIYIYVKDPQQLFSIPSEILRKVALKCDLESNAS
ncbi:MAG: hypothetical protein DRO00_08575 [Thermoproteota archaeon]|nr:MAG: hypothetical protein DRO00_08575 [Candidatus Korarchaeota archaeon]